MDWINKKFLIGLCGSLLIALIAICIIVPLAQRPQQSTQTATPADQKANGFDHTQLRSYIDVTARYCTSERPNPPSEWRKKFICESKVTDVVLAILTFFLAVFTFLLVRVGSRQERTTRQQMRAFVYLESASLINITSPVNPLPSYKPTGAEIISRSDGPLANLIIKNTGSTPAFKVVHWAGICLADYPLKTGLPKRIAGNVRIPYSSIPPNGVTTKFARLPNPLTAEEVQGLRHGTRAIYVYGEIDYIDAFRRKRKTTYRLFHNAVTGNIGVTTDLTLAELGNDAT